MNLRASYRYQIADHKKSILVFYLVIFCIYALMGMSISVMIKGNGGTYGSISGLEISTVVFLFVTGLNTFKENFGMLTQNGISRRSLMVGRLLVMLTVCLFMTLLDRIWFFCGAWLHHVFGDSINAAMLMDMMYNRAKDVSTLRLHMEALAFNFSLYFAAMSVGYLITVVFYRLNKIWKTILGAGLPIFFLILLPLLDAQVFRGLISYYLGSCAMKFFGFTSGNPLYAVLSFLVISAVALLGAWFVMRRAPLHE